MEQVYLKIKGIEGNNLVAGYEKSIACSSYNVGVFATHTSDVSNNDRSHGRAYPSPLTITKGIDKATPGLEDAVNKSMSLGDIELHIVREEGGKVMPYMTYVFGKAKIDAFQNSSGIETVSFSYSTKTSKFEGQNTDGTKSGTAASGFDYAKNAPLQAKGG